MWRSVLVGLGWGGTVYMRRRMNQKEVQWTLQGPASDRVIGLFIEATGLSLIYEHILGISLSRSISKKDMSDIGANIH